MKERVSSVLRKERGGRGGGGEGRRTKGILGYVSECQPDSFRYYTLQPVAANTPPTHRDTHTVSYPEHVVRVCEEEKLKECEVDVEKGGGREG